MILDTHFQRIQSRSTSSRCSKLVLQWALEGGNDNESSTLLVLHIIVHHKYPNPSHPMTRSFVFSSELTCALNYNADVIRCYFTVLCSHLVTVVDSPLTDCKIWWPDLSHVEHFEYPVVSPFVFQLSFELLSFS